MDLRPKPKVTKCVAAVLLVRRPMGMQACKHVIGPAFGGVLNDLPVQGLSVTVSRTNFSYRDTHLQNVYAGLGWMTQLATAPPQPLPVMILMVEASLSCKTAHSKTSTRPCSSEALTCPAPSTEDSCMSYGTGSVILSPKS